MESGSGSLEALREANRLRVIDALRHEGSASRTDLVRITGLSRTTITTLVGDLQERGLVVEQEEHAVERPERPGRGRPPVLLRLAPSAGAALGLDFGHRHVRVAVADLSSTVLAERRIDVDVDVAAATALDAAAGLVEEVLREAGVDRAQVVGAGMGLPGPIDRRTGTVGSSVILPGWAGVHAAEELARRIDFHVEVDNDANLGALAEFSLGAGRGMQDMVYVKVSSGIGAGLVLGGRLHHGATGIAGEIGHVQVRADGAVCRCGNRGCLETVASGPALLNVLRPVHDESLTLAGMLELAAAGDLGTQRVINDAGRAIGQALGDLCNSLNPSMIVVGGDVSAAGAPLLDGIRETVDRYAQPGAAQAVTVTRGVLGERAEVLGALTLVIADTERLRSVGLAALVS
ncbi:ROK family transcriptional regulator [Candidatus Solirubrobacter pratensis]|uniref:ROK family transcriptional regulator n=1 Tax=Candidatus Solirubrobacter pratensis TaxID=1298857 RepID=UPI000416294B|nr:ROK family transcriptional regulator [Candidatus Solirubrobacter pratensis]